jgi:hypothetical protein
MKSICRACKCLTPGIRGVRPKGSAPQPDRHEPIRRELTQRLQCIGAPAEAPPDQLYQRGENAKMFERTASRLDEMQTREWLDLPHLP